MDARPVAVAVLLALVAVAPAGQAQARGSSGTVHVAALAVSEVSGTFVGVPADVAAQVLEGGSGQVYVATKPLAQTDMQGSARLASRVAASVVGVDAGRYDFLVEFTSASAVIGGPSAGGEMTLGLATALHNLVDPGHPWSLDAHVAGTGTINPDGTIGPVGGIPAKAQAARDAGITLFLYPAGLDQASTLQAGRTVLVDMQAHCAKLGIVCRPVAHVREILEAAAHVTLATPPAPAASTSDYANVLSPTVRAQVQGLQDRVVALEGHATASLAQSYRTRIGQATQAARMALDQAAAALAQHQYYLAATRSFRGAIEAGYAENLTRYYEARTDPAVVSAAVDGCVVAVQAAEAKVAGLQATGATSLEAVASAQQRVANAQALRDEAQTAQASATGGLTALHQASFCTERSGTAQWWASLQDAFGAGPGVPDLRALASDQLGTAQEMVNYAEAVEGGATQTDARAALATAQADFDAGRHPAAILGAIQAHAIASVAMQTGGSQVAVAPQVLAAARESADRAIAAARQRGVEPLLAVSLVELSEDQRNDTAQQLESLWTARMVALVDEHPTALTAFVSRPAPQLGADSAVAVLLVGAALGAALAGAAVALVGGLRRPRNPAPGARPPGPGMP